MRSLKVTPENFENQLQTVKEEKRSSIDNQPYAPAELKLGELSLIIGTMAHPVIGDFKDLEDSSIEMCGIFSAPTMHQTTQSWLSLAILTRRRCIRWWKNISPPLPDSQSPPPVVTEPEQKQRST